ncbi:MAG: division/cell wall cluster transcriptional repressor MraZ [Anaerolineae bacterium]
MFFGEYEHSIDDKGRLTIPAKFRDDLEGGVVMTRGLDGCLWAFPRYEWEKLAEKISTMPSTNSAARSFTRFMFSSAFDSIPDRQGRVLIPQKLRDYAGITSETAVIGVMNRVEIWNPAKWNEAFSKVEADPDAIVQQLEELGINI